MYSGLRLYVVTSIRVVFTPDTVDSAYDNHGYKGRLDQVLKLTYKSTAEYNDHRL